MPGCPYGNRGFASASNASFALTPGEAMPNRLKHSGSRVSHDAGIIGSRMWDGCFAS